MDVLGCLRIRVRRGINLAVRDTISSDPYVTITCGSQKVKTKVVKGNCNPRWNQELTICIKDINAPITLSVYDKDTFTGDDSMGNAKIYIKPLLDCINMGLDSLPDGTKVDRVQPSKDNDLADESPIVWNKGKMTQDMLLRLKNVECGQIEIQVEWIELPGNKALSLPSRKINPNRPKIKLKRLRPAIQAVMTTNPPPPASPVADDEVMTNPPRPKTKKLHKIRPVVEVLIPLRRFKKGLATLQKKGQDRCRQHKADHGEQKA